MTGMLSTETADIAQLRGGGNPFEGVPIGLPEGIGRRPAMAPQPLPRPEMGKETPQREGRMETVREETPGAPHGPTAASQSSTDDTGVVGATAIPQRMRRGMSVGGQRSPTGIEKPAYDKESKAARRERLRSQDEDARAALQPQQMVVGATDPVHGVPQWAWDLNENGVEGAKLHPPNMEQSVALHAIMVAIKGDSGYPGWGHEGPMGPLWTAHGEHGMGPDNSPPSRPGVCDARQKWPFGVKEKRVADTLTDVVSCCSGVSGYIPMRWEAREKLWRLGEVFIGEGLRRYIYIYGVFIL